jgi:hypothetical protein
VEVLKQAAVPETLASAFRICRSKQR